MGQSESPPRGVACSSRVELIALGGLPLVSPGDDLAALIHAALVRESIALVDGDVVVVTSKIVSRAEGRFVDLGGVTASARALELGAQIGKDPRFVECVLAESSSVSRVVRGGALVVRHRLGFVCANAGIDASNARPLEGAEGEAAPPTSSPGASSSWVLLLPRDPDGAAERIRARLSTRHGAAIGVVITDSLGRPFRIGTVGSAIGLAGVPALWDRRGDKDLFGKTLEITITGLGDQIAAAADLVAGQADEARPVVLLRGLSFPVAAHAAAELYRRPEDDVYA